MTGIVVQEKSTYFQLVDMTVRRVPITRTRRPVVGSDLQSCAVVDGYEVTGCFVSRLSPGIVPELMGLVFADCVDDSHVWGTRGLFRRVLKPSGEHGERFDLLAGESRFTDLAVSGFELRANKGNAVHLKVDVSGGDVQDVGSTHNLSYLKERFFFFDGSGISLDGGAVWDCAGFRLSGDYRFNGGFEKRFMLKVRCRMVDGFDYSDMKLKKTARLSFECPQMYEIKQKGRFGIEMDVQYIGETSYRNEHGVWGWEFRYWGFGVQAEVFCV